MDELPRSPPLLRYPIELAVDLLQRRLDAAKVGRLPRQGQLGRPQSRVEAARALFEPCDRHRLAFLRVRQRHVARRYGDHHRKDRQDIAGTHRAVELDVGHCQMISASIPSCRRAAY